MNENILHLSHTPSHETMNKLSQIPENKSSAKSAMPSSCICSLSKSPLLNLSLMILLGIFSTQTAFALEGASLHEENCIACHAAMTGGEGSVLYTRDDRAVKSQDALTKQVNRCQSSLGLGWSNTEISSVQRYLNQSFYKF